MDGIKINGRHSYLDFGLYVKEREIGVPQRRSIRKSVPYCHGSYDFSALNGEIAYADRQLAYVFDVTGDSVEELEQNKAEVCAWLMEAQEIPIYDDACPYVHFVGSVGSIAWSPDENGLQGELAVTFDCYPFKIRDEALTAKLTGSTARLVIQLEGMSAVVTAVSTVATTVTDGTVSTSLKANTATQLDFTLVHGKNTLSQTGKGTVTFTYYEEVV